MSAPSTVSDPGVSAAAPSIPARDEAIVALRRCKHDLIRRHAKPDNVRGMFQVATTLGPVAALWAVAAMLAPDSAWLAAGLVVPPMSLFLLRVFVLMHDCGHGSLFRSARLNRGVGFALGVISGMPQYVWSQNHAFHHATNGDWSRYRGPLNVATVDEYRALSPRAQARYRRARSIWMAPIAGLLYLVVNPRITWLRGSLDVAVHAVRGRLAQPSRSLAVHAAAFTTPRWNSWKEYRHMTANNLVLLAAWAVMVWAVGAGTFALVYGLSMALAGGGAIVLFTVQHNFEHSYASDTEGWDHDEAALHGTSVLVLPAWLNWFSADIAFHHVHHLSSRIPNYHLARCHAEHEALFAGVTRVPLSGFPGALKYLLWDRGSRRLVTVAECTG
jgi:omega-6 fatty acid desaturase (delta-12 desaturase)